MAVLYMATNISPALQSVLAFSWDNQRWRYVCMLCDGVLLGLICVDYSSAGYTKFLLGWLMPHGVIEIPAILIAGQAGLVLAKALVGWGERNTVTTRLRIIGPDLVTLIGGVALML